jgi:hypothetical protein
MVDVTRKVVDSHLRFDEVNRNIVEYGEKVHTIWSELRKLTGFTDLQNGFRMLLAGNWKGISYSLYGFQLVDDRAPHGTAGAKIICVSENVEALLCSRECH